MARKFDSKVDLFTQWQQARDTASKLRKELKMAEDTQKALLNDIIKAMGSSTVATIAGVNAFEIVDRPRRSVSIDTVMDVCPELADQLIRTSHSTNIKVL